MTKKIFHICIEDSWQSQLGSDEYIHDSLALENFIHCCEKHQIEGVLARYFQDVSNLLLLTIEPSKVNAEIKVEQAPNGMFFPHIYGPLNKSAIVKKEKIR